MLSSENVCFCSHKKKKTNPKPITHWYLQSMRIWRRRCYVLYRTQADMCSPSVNSFFINFVFFVAQRYPRHHPCPFVCACVLLLNVWNETTFRGFRWTMIQTQKKNQPHMIQPTRKGLVHKHKTGSWTHNILFFIFSVDTSKPQLSIPSLSTRTVSKNAKYIYTLCMCVGISMSFFGIEKEVFLWFKIEHTNISSDFWRWFKKNWLSIERNGKNCW